MDYRQLWKGKKNAIGEGPITVWATKHPEARVYVGAHRIGFTNIVAMSYEEARRVAQEILAFVDEIESANV